MYFTVKVASIVFNFRTIFNLLFSNPVWAITQYISSSLSPFPSLACWLSIFIFVLLNTFDFSLLQKCYSWLFPSMKLICLSYSCELSHFSWPIRFEFWSAIVVLIADVILVTDMLGVQSVSYHHGFLTDHLLVWTFLIVSPRIAHWNNTPWILINCPCN